MQKKEVEIFYPTHLTMWRKWLEKNHLSKQAVWLVFYNKSSNKNPSLGMMPLMLLFVLVG